MDSNEIKCGMVRPENGVKMLEAEENITNLIDYVSGRMGMEQRELTRQANKALYELAEKNGESLWSLCYRLMPNWKPLNSAFEGVEDGVNIKLHVDWELELIPLRIDWQHGEGYWEKKYKDLKERVKGLIDNKED